MTDGADGMLHVSCAATGAVTRERYTNRVRLARGSDAGARCFAAPQRPVMTFDLA
jgi:hypothetical protein